MHKRWHFHHDFGFALLIAWMIVGFTLTLTLYVLDGRHAAYFCIALWFGVPMAIFTIMLGVSLLVELWEMRPRRITVPVRDDLRSSRSDDT